MCHPRDIYKELTDLPSVSRATDRLIHELFVLTILRYKGSTTYPPRQLRISTPRYPLPPSTEVDLRDDDRDPSPFHRVPFGPLSNRRGPRESWTKECPPAPFTKLVQVFSLLSRPNIKRKEKVNNGREVGAIRREAGGTGKRQGVPHRQEDTQHKRSTESTQGRETDLKSD